MLTTNGDWACVRSPSDAWRRATEAADQGQQALVLESYGEGPWGTVGSAERRLPAAKWYTRHAWKAPFLWLALLALGPQIIGSVVNISYNFTEIVNNDVDGARLTEEQSNLFLHQLVPLYNGVVYPLLVGLGIAVVAPVYRAWRRLHSADRVDDEQEVQVDT